MNKLSVVVAFSLNPNCSGLKMLWIWIFYLTWIVKLM